MWSKQKVSVNSDEWFAKEGGLGQVAISLISELHLFQYADGS